jgi:membrane protein DedA with SNARE-associated domain
LLTHLTDTLTQLITNLYITTGLLGIVMAMALESCCIPLPSEVVMPLAGIMIASQKILQGVNPFLALVFVALAGALGCLLGSIIAYWIGYSGGRPLMLKYGRYVLISKHDADKADEFFQHWGSATAFFSRLLPVVRTYISLPAGIARMPFARFCLYTLLGSFPWSLGLAYAGYILGNHLSVLAPIFHSLDIVILILVALLVVLYIWRHIHNDRKAREADAVSAAQQLPPSNPSQPWGQQVSMPQGWNQQAMPASQQLSQTAQAWGQPAAPQSPMLQPQQSWGQMPSQVPHSSYPQQVPQSWGQSTQYPQQPNHPQQRQRKPQQADDDRTILRQ